MATKSARQIQKEVKEYLVKTKQFDLDPNGYHMIEQIATIFAHKRSILLYRNALRGKVSRVDHAKLTALIKDATAGIEMSMVRGMIWACAMAELNHAFLSFGEVDEYVALHRDETELWGMAQLMMAGSRLLMFVEADDENDENVRAVIQPLLNKFGMTLESRGFGWRKYFNEGWEQIRKDQSL